MLKIIILVYIYLVLQMSFMWLLYRIFKNPSVVDVSWSIGLMNAGLIYICHNPINERLWVISSLLAFWALRLAGYLWFTRVRKGHVDKRYLQLSENWKMAKSLGFFLNFQLQGIFILIISSVFLFASLYSRSTLSLLDKAGIAIVILGIVGETVADFQLSHFKQMHKGKVCNIGLWSLSRHPNYFFELIVWCGFTLFALQQTYGWFAVIAPLWLYIIFTKMTIPITERGSIKSRGQAYLDYQKRTSMFFPSFRKLANSA